LEKCYHSKESTSGSFLSHKYEGTSIGKGKLTGYVIRLDATYETTTACRDIYGSGSDSMQPMAGQAQFERQCETHGCCDRKLHQRGAVFCNKIYMVRRSETEGDTQHDSVDSALWWKLYE
jgi:hypothetical protein